MNKLTSILKERGLNASSLSDLMTTHGHKLSRISIGSILNGNSSPKLSTLEYIAEVLDLTVCDLLDGQNSKAEMTTSEMLEEIKSLSDRVLDNLNQSE